MLAYNFRKHNFQKSDHVRKILAKLDAKQSKTGLSLYNQVQSRNNSTSPGDSPKNEEKSSFPNVKRARKKVQNRITTDNYKYQTNMEQQARCKHAPHRLPGNTAVNLPPVSMLKPEDRIQQPNSIPEQQFDKGKLDINVNPFGYNRKTLALDTRKINYVVEWPETWPFKITSFQGKKKTLQNGQRKPRPLQDINDNKPVVENEEARSVNELSEARVLAPVDYPVKRHVLSNKPYVESSLMKRGIRKTHPKDIHGQQFVLKTRENTIELNASSGDDVTGNEKNETDENTNQCLTTNLNPIMPEMSREQIDSCPPSTPVPNGQEPRDQAPGLSEKYHRNDDQSSDDLRQEGSSLLNDIVNQIISDTEPLTI